MVATSFGGLSPLIVSKKKKKSSKKKKKSSKKKSSKNNTAALLRAIAHTQGVRPGKNGSITIDPNSPWTRIFREIYSERTAANQKRGKGQQRGSGLNILQTIGSVISAVPQIAIGLLSSVLS